MAIKEKFLESCARYSAIQPGDKIPVGGDMFDAQRPMEADCDFDQLEPFLSASVHKFRTVGLKSLEGFIKQNDLNVEPELLAAMLSFTTTLPAFFQIGGPEAEDREPDYRQKRTLKLSAIFNAGQAQCAELAILASRYLDCIGVENSYFTGGFHENADDECNEPHGFILMPRPSHVLVFDPAQTTNPLSPFYSSLDRDVMDAWLDRGKTNRSIVFAQPELQLRPPVAYAIASPGSMYFPQDVINPLAMSAP